MTDDKACVVCGSDLDTALELDTGVCDDCADGPLFQKDRPGDWP